MTKKDLNPRSTWLLQPMMCRRSAHRQDIHGTATHHALHEAFHLRLDLCHLVAPVSLVSSWLSQHPKLKNISVGVKLDHFWNPQVGSLKNRLRKTTYRSHQYNILVCKSPHRKTNTRLLDLAPRKMPSSLSMFTKDFCFFCTPAQCLLEDWRVSNATNLSQPQKIAPHADELEFGRWWTRYQCYWHLIHSHHVAEKLNLFGSFTGFRPLCLFDYGLLGCKGSKGFMKQTLTTRPTRFTTKIICKYRNLHAMLELQELMRLNQLSAVISRSHHDMHKNQRHDVPAKDIHRIYIKTCTTWEIICFQPFLRPGSIWGFFNLYKKVSMQRCYQRHPKIICDFFFRNKTHPDWKVCLGWFWGTSIPQRWWQPPDST